MCIRDSVCSVALGYGGVFVCFDKDTVGSYGDAGFGYGFDQLGHTTGHSAGPVSYTHLQSVTPVSMLKDSSNVLPMVRLIASSVTFVYW